MAMTEQFMTAEDVEQLRDTECRYDLIRGKLVEMAHAGGYHGEIAGGIVGRLWVHAHSNQLGTVYASETGFVLARNPDVVLGPDAAFIQRDRVPERQQGYYEIAPDLVVEVVSPNDSNRYVTDKVMEYLDNGVKLVWIVDPERQIVTVYHADRSARIVTSDETLDGEDVLPGFSVQVAELFR